MSGGRSEASKASQEPGVRPREEEEEDSGRKTVGGRQWVLVLTEFSPAEERQSIDVCSTAHDLLAIFEVIFGVNGLLGKTRNSLEGVL